MRGDFHNGPLRAKVFAGTYVVLMAFDLEKDKQPGLRGFAIKCGKKGQPQKWLHGTKYFGALVPAPKPADDYSSRDQPFQTFLWSDYGADPATDYVYTIVALYGPPQAMVEKYTLTFDVTTEVEDDGKHGVWFNRGAIASHAFATKFNNKQLTKDMVNNVSDAGVLLDSEVAWLSRGLGEAMLRYINSTQKGEGLRVCAYEFTYAPVLEALKRAIDRGVDVEIIFHGTDPNRKAIAAANLPEDRIHQRTHTAIPHNKYMVKLEGDKPKKVWTGSTNITDTGLYGQTNVGHLVTDDALAATYLAYWTELKDDPAHSVALENAVRLSPNPPNVPKSPSITPFYSPRIADNMLDWYADRTADASGLVMMTIPFNVAPTILNGLAKPSDALRLVILENVPTKDVLAAEKASKGKLIFSNGALLGQQFDRNTKGGGKVTPIPNTDLDKWFIEEELARPTNEGFVFFVHSKVLVIDALSDDPLVCSGSANFSSNSLTANDENMLLIRGSTRVADIYITEMDRIFRHFHARDEINDMAKQGNKNNPLLLDTTDQWIADNLKPDSYKNNRRLLFFPQGAVGAGWATKAAKDPDVFADEDQRAEKKRQETNAKAKARRDAAAGKPAKKAKKAVAKAVKKKAAKKAPKAAAKKVAKKAAKKAVKKIAKKATKKVTKKAKKAAVKKVAKKAKKKPAKKRAKKVSGR
jgi:phosphatidylserine/phosphatidylglycerophosphate/cardiolipin synthase-like enzyme